MKTRVDAWGYEERYESCTAEVWSLEYFSADAVDPYWIRCTRTGFHVTHEDAHTGLKWGDK